MAATISIDLHSIAGDSWRSGLRNLARHELYPWLRTRFGLIQALVWLVVLNGFMAVPLWIAPRLDPGEQAAIANDGGPMTLGLMLFFRLGIQICSIGAAILAMGALVGEKQSGTAAWVLSKPASRTAFVLAKLVGLSIGTMITMVGLNAALAYLHIGIVSRQLPNPGPFVVGSALLGLAVLFAIALTVMLGAFFDSRGAVVGTAIAVLVGQQLLGSVLGPIAAYLPNSLGDLAAGIALGQAPTSFAAVATTAMLTVVCVAVGIWRFGRDEL